MADNAVPRVKLKPKAKLRIALDSGAFSLFMRANAGKPKAQQVKLDKTPEFKPYLDRYIECLHTYGDRLWMYVMLDIIRDQAASWKVLKYMESCGLKPLPVLSLWADRKWMHKLLDNYEWFCIGGMGSGLVGRNKISHYLDGVFKAASDSKGAPRVKIHGLAMTGNLAARFPWYSVDSITWRYDAAVGQIKLPVLRNGRMHLHTVPLSDRRVHDKTHVSRLAPAAQRVVRKYIEDLGVDYNAVVTDHQVRSLVAANGYLKFAEYWRQRWLDKTGFEGWNLLFAGDPLSNGQNERVFTRLRATGWTDTVTVFETFWTSFLGKTNDKSKTLIKKYFGDKQ